MEEQVQRPILAAAIVEVLVVTGTHTGEAALGTIQGKCLCCGVPGVAQHLDWVATLDNGLQVVGDGGMLAVLSILLPASGRVCRNHMISSLAVKQQR